VVVVLGVVGVVLVGVPEADALTVIVPVMMDGWMMHL